MLPWVCAHGPLTLRYRKSSSIFFKTVKKRERTTIIDVYVKVIIAFIALGWFSCERKLRRYEKRETFPSRGDTLHNRRASGGAWWWCV